MLKTRTHYNNDKGKSGQIVGTKKNTIYILGAGIMGCALALALAKKYPSYSIELIEEEENALRRASACTACRVGAGFHYSDIETAIKYLRATIKAIKEYSDCILAGDQPLTHPHRRGRYFVTKDSLFSLEHTRKVFDALKEEYTKLVANDPSIEKLFGPPENFYRELRLEEYQDDVNMEKVQAAFETAEQVLDWAKFEEKLNANLKGHANITLRAGTFVESIKGRYTENHPDFTIVTRLSNSPCTPVREELARYIINSTWHDIERLSETAGFHKPTENRATKRLKIIIGIDLPDDFENDAKAAHSMFFCFGPHCSFTNLGKDPISGKYKGFLSYEPVTNIMHTQALELPPEMQRLLDGKASEDEIKTYSQKIIDGAITYAPKLAGAKFNDIYKIGIVKCAGEVDIYSRESTIHSRRETGIEPKSLGYMDAGAPKLWYFAENTEILLSLINEDVQIYNEINKIIKELGLSPNKLDSSKNKIYTNALIENLQRFLWFTDPMKNKSRKESSEKIIDDTDKMIRGKAEVMQEIKIR